ncbi:MAG: flagellin lysine-N-methylase [Lachnospiraceae bacterium]|nr:flagellin lysine-N-methylase [Lachnospiraceae bacterium]
MDNCPETCCHGWMIPITVEDNNRFKNETGLLKLRLKLAIRNKELKCFNAGSGTCPFLVSKRNLQGYITSGARNKQGLCSLQLSKGHDFLPEACRMFPRFYRNYGTFEEHYIDLSCTAAAELFLKHHKDLRLIKYSGNPLSSLCTTNDDSDYLTLLVRIRTSITDRLCRVTSMQTLNTVVLNIYSHSAMIQNFFLTGKKASEFLNKETPLFPDTKNNTCISEVKNPFFPAGIGFYSDIMSTSFYHPMLKKTNPSLFKLCNLYINKYNDIMNSEKKWKELVSSFIDKYNYFPGIMSALMAYYLYLYYLKNYEDYSFTKNASLGIIHINMILMFTILHELEQTSIKKSDKISVITHKDIARIISVYIRRACYNDRILDEMYKCFEQ